MRGEEEEGMGEKWRGGPAGGMWTERAGEQGRSVSLGGRKEAGTQGEGSASPIPPPGLDREKNTRALRAEREQSRVLKTVVQQCFKMMMKGE